MTWSGSSDPEPAVGATGRVAGCKDDDVQDAVLSVTFPAPSSTPTELQELAVTYLIDDSESTVRVDFGLTLCAPRHCTYE